MTDRLAVESTVAILDLLQKIAVALNVYHDATAQICQRELEDWLARSKDAERYNAIVAAFKTPSERHEAPLPHPARRVITIREVADHV